MQESDEISSPGIGYYSLRSTTMSKDIINNNEGKVIFVEKAIETIVPEKENRTFTIQTTNGYFKTNKEIKIIKHMDNEVTFELPFGVNNVQVTTMLNNEKIETEYEVE